MQFRTWFGGLVAGGVILFAGCAGDGDSGAATQTPPGGTATPPAAASSTATRSATVFVIPTPTASPEATISATCPVAPSDAYPAGETSKGTITSGDRERSFLIHVPGIYDPAVPTPLVLNFHGLGSSASQQHIYAGLAPLAEREGFIVVSPEGVNRSWLLVPGVNDIQFTRDLVAGLSEVLCIDPGAVFSTGMSNGGFMSAALACVAGDLVAAVAPVAGILGPTMNCGDPVPILQFHGTDDAVVPYDGGTITATGGPFDGIDAIMARWAEHNGCSIEPTTSEASSAVDFVEFVDCEAETAHYVVEGGGHTWPGGPAVARLGATTAEISASELMWEFFMENRRRPD